MKKYIFSFLLVLTASFILYYSFPKIYADDAIDAIVGEASNQSLDTMICVGQAIRHRGTLKGVYGLHARHNYSESADTWEMAEEAWSESGYLKDKVKGCKNFGIASDLDKLRIRQYKVRCGDIYFY